MLKSLFHAASGFVVAACLAATSASGQTTTLPDSALLTPGTIAFAADFAAAPNQFLNADGTQDGLDVDLCGAVAQKLGKKIEWTNLAFPGLVPGLQGKRFDALCTAIFINPDRQKIMNMVPYVKWGEGLMVPKASALAAGCSFKSGDDKTYDACFDALSGKTVSVAASGTTNTHLTEQSSRMAKAGKASITIRAFDTNADAIQAVVSGQADAGYLNDPQAAFFINRTNSNFKLAFTGFASNELALATLKPNTALADALMGALEAMKGDGSYKKILDKWGVAEASAFAYQK